MLRREKKKKFKQSCKRQTCPLYYPHVLNPLQLLPPSYLIRAARRRWDRLVCVSHAQQVFGLSGSCHWSVNRGGSTRPRSGAHELEHVAETPPAEALAASALQAKQPLF